MKKVIDYEIKENSQLNPSIYKMVLKGDTTWCKRPGQFIEITVDNGYLKRPISICDYNENELTIIYKTVGKGTYWMSQQPIGATINAIVSLGNGFNINPLGQKLVLIGGGVGIPPLYLLAKTALAKGKDVTVILGFQSKADSFYIQEFKDLNIPVYDSTNDGSLGTKGFVTNVMEEYDLTTTNYCCCGPLVMMKAIAKTSSAHGLLSLESKMGCGFGACMGCSIETKKGYRRICKEGPVFRSEDLIWENLI